MESIELIAYTGISFLGYEKISAQDAVKDGMTSVVYCLTVRLRCASSQVTIYAQLVPGLSLTICHGEADFLLVEMRPCLRNLFVWVLYLLRFLGYDRLQGLWDTLSKKVFMSECK